LREVRPRRAALRLRNDRIEVFDKTGALKRVIDVKPGTAYSPAPDGAPGRKAIGSALDVAFSPDPEQKYMYVVDTGNEVLWILDHESGRILGGFGSAGHNAGEFTLLHMIAVDSKGTLYTTKPSMAAACRSLYPAASYPSRDSIPMWAARIMTRCPCLNDRRNLAQEISPIMRSGRTSPGARPSSGAAASKPAGGAQMQLEGELFPSKSK
jgi:hypothetical protein